jgi:hypothetical protein
MAEIFAYSGFYLGLGKEGFRRRASITVSAL